MNDRNCFDCGKPPREEATVIRHVADMNVEVREQMRGGAGKVVIRHLFKKEEIKAKTRLCSHLTLEPGCGIGTHQHVGEDELFVITRGSGLLDDGQTKTRVRAGDAILTGNGEAHALHNDGAEPLELLAIIMLY